MQTRNAGIGRGDLLRIRAVVKEMAGNAWTGELCRYSFDASIKADSSGSPLKSILAALKNEQVGPDSLSEMNADRIGSTVERNPVPDAVAEYWAPVKAIPLKELPAVERRPRVRPLTVSDVSSKPELRPEPQPLVPWARLWPALMNALGETVNGVSINTKELVRSLSQLKPMKRVPKVRRRGWSFNATVIVESSERLLPFHDDIFGVIEGLRKIRTREELQVCCLCADDVDQHLGAGSISGPVLVIGEFGSLSSDVSCTRKWSELGRRLSEKGISCTALVLCPPGRLPRAMSAGWNCLCWDVGLPMRRCSGDVQHETQRIGQETSEITELLLNAVSPAVRVEPSLLRQLRLECAGGQASILHEYETWFHSDTFPPRAVLSISPDVAVSRRQRFAVRDMALKERIARMIVAHHRYCGQTVRFPEMRNLRECGVEIPEFADAELAEFLPRVRETLRQSMETGEYSLSRELLLEEWLDRELGRSSDAARSDESFSQAWYLRRKGLGESEFVWPTGISKAAIERLKLEVVPDPGSDARWRVRQWGDRLVVEPCPTTENLPPAPVESGAELVQFLLRRKGLDISTLDRRGQHKSFHNEKAISTDPIVLDGPSLRELRVESDRGGVILRRLRRPNWASGFGRDSYGLYVDLKVRKVGFRLRFIPPGTFRMGSPKTERGRDGDEGPQHWVTISKGFWMAETTCTQELWTALNPKNPSHFKGPSHPVDNVSHQNCTEFVNALNLAVPEAGFRLPTEAEWEYACRAGTQGPFCDGSTEGLDEREWEEKLGRYGWYTRNSDNKTHPVAELKPNNWGMYDMHGNVWEWCADEKRVYEEAGSHVVDPTEFTGAKAGRVLRGGSYWSDAWWCRSAIRLADEPVSRLDYFGFRLVAGLELKSQ